MSILRVLRNGRFDLSGLRFYMILIMGHPGLLDKLTTILPQINIFAIWIVIYAISAPIVNSQPNFDTLKFVAIVSEINIYLIYHVSLECFVSGVSFIDTATGIRVCCMPMTHIKASVGPVDRVLCRELAYFNCTIWADTSG